MTELKEELVLEITVQDGLRSAWIECHKTGTAWADDDPRYRHDLAELLKWCPYTRFGNDITFDRYLMLVLLHFEGELAVRERRKGKGHPSDLLNQLKIMKEKISLVEKFGILMRLEALAKTRHEINSATILRLRAIEKQP